jgi:hypothetical protein
MIPINSLHPILEPINIGHDLNLERMTKPKSWKGK